MNATNTLYFRINFKKRFEAEWYQRMNAKFNNRTHIEEPLRLNFIYKLN